MAKKNQRTVCTGLEWSDFLFLIESLKRKEEYRFMILIAAGVYLGLRASDIIQLKWEQLLNHDTFEVKEKKTGKSRFLTVNPALKELVQVAADKLQPPENSLLMTNRKGGPISIQHFNRKLHGIFNEYKIPAGNGSTHTLRKTFGKRIFQLNNKSENSLILLSKVFNHSSTAITREYLGITQSYISDVFLSL